jgi:hypothetical protein
MATLPLLCNLGIRLRNNNILNSPREESHSLAIDSWRPERLPVEIRYASLMAEYSFRTMVVFP